ncbi:hypothetical protein KJ903_00560, partial [Patescibacteria group bacterium]|nr:hypothetical protein [Patescibacteria group bacterium]
GTSGAGDGMPVKVNDDTSFLGEIWGGTSKGNTADGQSLVIADSMRPKMDVTNDNGSAGYQWLNTYTKYLIASGSVTTADLNASGTVGANTVNAGTVIAPAIDTDSLQGEYTVASVNIADGAVGTGKLADEAVSSAKIQDGGITGSDIATDANLTVGEINWSTTQELYTSVAGSACSGIGVSNLLNCLSDGSGIMIAYWNVNLPHGSEIFSFTGMLGEASGVSLNLKCILTRRYADGASGGVDVIATIYSTGINNATERVSTDSISNATVDNDNFAYEIGCAAVDANDVAGGPNANDLWATGFSVGYRKSMAD